ncbi:hypothetical protein UCD39_10925 [Nitrospirillum sp. BR 11752]|uniref:hypothetical protein n=1 Tax=Nitrospirillum sp. BR 11752 TaxID=3104293 RepID=UPI002EBBA5CC|nr:hypothetical protein [Nitrospirillum sp. BR 11752]
MPTLPTLDRLVLVPVVVSAMAGAAIALAGALSIAEAPALALPPPLPTVTLPMPSAARPAADGGEALRRPLFSQSRRPPPPKPSLPPPTQVQAPDLLVVGIIAGASSGIATGTDKRLQKPFRLRTGDTLGEWQVDSITKTRLRLRHEDQVQDYPLATPPPIPPSPPPR